MVVRDHLASAGTTEAREVRSALDWLVWVAPDHRPDRGLLVLTRARTASMCACRARAAARCACSWSDSGARTRGTGTGLVVPTTTVPAPLVASRLAALEAGRPPVAVGGPAVRATLARAPDPRSDALWLSGDGPPPCDGTRASGTWGRCPLSGSCPASGAPVPSTRSPRDAVDVWTPFDCARRTRRSRRGVGTGSIRWNGAAGSPAAFSSAAVAGRSPGVCRTRRVMPAPDSRRTSACTWCTSGDATGADGPSMPSEPASTSDGVRRPWGMDPCGARPSLGCLHVGRSPVVSICQFVRGQTAAMPGRVLTHLWRPAAAGTAIRAHVTGRQLGMTTEA